VTLSVTTRGDRHLSTSGASRHVNGTVWWSNGHVYTQVFSQAYGSRYCRLELHARAGELVCGSSRFAARCSSSMRPTRCVTNDFRIPS